uniref:Uncharacterized protein n=1 Tax=Arundo donax TaxID=35708 RepID=A0A0A8XNI7_ARUDO
MRTRVAAAVQPRAPVVMLLRHTGHLQCSAVRSVTTILFYSSR